jgi:hypothetical protein
LYYRSFCAPSHGAPIRAKLLFPNLSVSNFNEIAKSQKSAPIVIPAKAGIQVFQFLMVGIKARPELDPGSGMTKSGLFTILSILKI